MTVSPRSPPPAPGPPTPTPHTPNYCCRCLQVIKGYQKFSATPKYMVRA